jgi:hypothetical protein
MKSKLPEIFTYEEDLSGKRKIRSYARVTLFVLAALTVFLALALVQQVQEHRGMAATKAIVLEPTSSPEAEPTPLAEACPADPSDWTLVDVFENDARKAIEPACVYAGLARSVAWALAIQEGYSRQEAADELGFTAFPLAQMAEVNVADHRQGHKTVKVDFVPPAPDFSEWYFDQAGRPAVSYSLRGCFRTFTIVGNLKQEWQASYPVVCEVSQDVEAANMVMCLDGHCYTAAYQPARYYGLYGYGGGGDWVWLGNETDARVDGIDAQQVREDRNDLMLSHGQSSCWDSSWLAETFQLESIPLPANWQDLTNEEDLQAIITSLNEQLTLGANP